MARKSKQKRDRERARRGVAALDDAAARAAALVASTPELARAVIDRCANAVEDIAADLALARLAAETWRGRDRASSLVELLEAFGDERRRHADALLELHRRSIELLRDERLHVVLDDDGPLRATIRAGLIDGAARLAAAYPNMP